jgi:hypothetical protein
MPIIETQRMEYKGHTIRAGVGKVKGDRWHAIVSVERKYDTGIEYHGFLEVPPTDTQEQALAEGWRCAREEIDREVAD